VYVEEGELLEAGDVSAVEDLEEFVHPAVGAGLEGDEEGLFEEF
jgi:hypothetical protein